MERELKVKYVKSISSYESSDDKTLSQHVYDETGVSVSGEINVMPNSVKIDWQRRWEPWQNEYQHPVQQPYARIYDKEGKCYIHERNEGGKVDTYNKYGADVIKCILSDESDKYFIMYEVVLFVDVDRIKGNNVVSIYSTHHNIEDRMKLECHSLFKYETDAISNDEKFKPLSIDDSKDEIVLSYYEKGVELFKLPSLGEHTSFVNSLVQKIDEVIKSGDDMWDLAHQELLKRDNL